MQGFKTLERTNVVVNANDRFSAGVLTLEVGGMTEEVSVTGRVSELQATSGERSFTLEGEAIKNIANNGRSLFGFATLVPGVVPSRQRRGRMSGPPEAPSGFTVNGQRPNSNNVTIDGVANIDTGDNGGNMATTNIDAVAEFKILTNAYQAEYGRAVGGQMQVVTKSGTQSFHGSGYWYGRRSDWNANTWTNKRAAAPPPVGSGELIELPEASRNDFGYTIGGPVYIPGVFNEDKKKLFFFWSQECQKRKDPVAERLSRVPTALERARGLLAERRQQRQPVPLHPRLHDRPARAAPSDTRGCFQDGGVLGRIPQSRLYAAGPQRPEHLPPAEHHGVERHQLHEPDARATRPVARSCCASTSRPRTGGASRAGTCRTRTRRSCPTAPARCGQQQPGHRPGACSTSPGGTGCSRPPASSTPRRRSRSASGAPTTRSTSTPSNPALDALGRGAHRHAAALPGRRPGGLHPGPALQRRTRRPERGLLSRPTTAPSRTRTRPTTSSPT